jgi:hypothetical protein
MRVARRHVGVRNEDVFRENEASRVSVVLENKAVGNADAVIDWRGRYGERCRTRWRLPKLLPDTALAWPLVI